MNEWVGSGVAQLAEWSLPNPEVHSSNPAIRKSYIEHLFTFYFMEKTKIKKKRIKKIVLKSWKGWRQDCRRRGKDQNKEKRRREWHTFFKKNINGGGIKTVVVVVVVVVDQCCYISEAFSSIKKMQELQ